MNRLEVLRGPQGTLYGKNTSAGVISVLTTRPTTERVSLLEADYDSNKRLAALRGMFNVPLGGSGHGLRMTGFSIDGEHLFQNTFTGEGVNNADKYGGRANFDYHGGLYAYYSVLESIGTFTQQEPLVDNVSIGGGLTLGSFFPDGSTNVDNNEYTTSSYAVVGQLTWNISEKLSTALEMLL